MSKRKALILFIFLCIPFVPRAQEKMMEKIPNELKQERELPAEQNNQGKKNKGKVRLAEELRQRSKAIIRPEIKYLKGGPKVTINFSHASIVDVLKAIGSQTNLNLIISDKVGGKTSVQLKDIPANQAIKDVLDIHGLYYIEEPNRVVKILTEEEYRKLALSYLTETKVFKIFQGNAKAIANSLVPVLTARIGRITIDEQSNHIIVTDVPGNLQRIKKILKPFTEPKRKIKISAHILEINLDDSNQLGINWEAGSENFKFVQSDFSNSRSNQSQGSLTIIGKEKQPFSDMNPNEYVKATLKLIGLDLDVTTLATPSIVANDSEGALIHIGRSIPYNETTTAGVNNTQTTSFKFLEVGTRLSFFPRLITNDDVINLRIKIEVSSSPGFVTFGKEGSIGKAPEKVSTTAQTTVNLTSGQRLIIGGLLSRSKTRETSGIPFLKDIPILKFLFSSASYQDETTETVIFLTTELVEGGEALPERLRKRIRDVGTSGQKKDLSVQEDKKD